jgi:putative FmdB family regulatory protein
LPIHDYVCVDCGHEMEVMHSVHGPGPAACPRCGGQMKKTLAVPSVHYKGTGWARKDRTAGSRAASKSASKESGSGLGETAAPDSTTAAAPAATPAPSKEPD